MLKVLAAGLLISGMANAAPSRSPAVLADPAMDLVSAIRAMPGIYHAVKQIAEDTYPSGYVEKSEITGDVSAAVEIYENAGDAAGFDVNFPQDGSSRYTTAKAATPDTVIVHDTNAEYPICSTTITARVSNGGYEFGLDDVQFDGIAPGDREYCLEHWVYPLRGLHRWEFDSTKRVIRIISEGEFEDLDGILVHRRLTLELARW